MVLGFLVGHMQAKNGREAKWRLRWEATDPGEEPRTYRMVSMRLGSTSQRKYQQRSQKERMINVVRELRMRRRQA